MSVNWSPKSFLQMMKHSTVSTADLVLGDVIDADYAYWQVASIKQNPDGTYEVLDEDKNGTSRSPADWKWLILDRSLFRERQGPNAPECHCGVKLIPDWRHQRDVCSDCFEMASATAYPASPKVDISRFSSLRATKTHASLIEAWEVFRSLLLEPMRHKLVETSGGDPYLDFVFLAMVEARDLADSYVAYWADSLYEAVVGFGDGNGFFPRVLKLEKNLFPASAQGEEFDDMVAQFRLSPERVSEIFLDTVKQVSIDGMWSPPDEFYTISVETLEAKIVRAPTAL